MTKYGKVPISAKALRQAVQKQPVAVAISLNETFFQFLASRGSAVEANVTTGLNIYTCKVRIIIEMLASGAGSCSSHCAC